MRRSWATRGGALAYGVLLLIGYAIVDDRYAGVVPGWVITVGFVVLFLGGGFALQGWDQRRWSRMARTLGFEPLGDTATDDGFTASAYCGRMHGRPVTVDLEDRPRSLVTDKSVISTSYRARAAPTLVLQRVGAGGTGGSDLPPAVELSAPGFEGGSSVPTRRIRDSPAPSSPRPSGMPSKTRGSSSSSWSGTEL